MGSKRIIPDGCENLTSRQLDILLGVQYSFHMEVAAYDSGIYGIPTEKEYNTLTDLYNNIIGLIHKNDIN